MKRLISLLIVMSFIVSASIVTFGYGGDGEGYSWTLDKETGILNIYGHGAMKDYTSGACPAYAGCINSIYTGPLAKYVYFNEGITHVSAYALTAGFPNMNYGRRHSCYNVIEVYLASSVSSVGEHAFNTELKKLYVYSDSIEFGQGAVPSTAVIYGYKDTDIENFARKNGNEFVAICRDHSSSLTNTLEPTCTEKGYSGDLVCTVCGITIQKGEVIPELGHDYKLVNNSEPDCVTDGYSGDVQCSRCLDIKEQGEAIPALGHSWSGWSVVSDPSCTGDGVKIRFCSVCDEQEKGTVLPLGHTLKETMAIDATCTENGNAAYFSCVVCNRLYTDADAVNETTPEDIVITATGHTESDWITLRSATFSEDGERIKECTVCKTVLETEVLPKLTNPFGDVPENAWYTKSVLYCFEKGYMNGMSADVFSPNRAITREQFVMILANLSDIDTDEYKSTDSGMTDIPKNKWYSGAVAWSVQQGYVSGVAEGMFGLGQPIQRAALARLLYLYAEKTGLDVSSKANLAVYDDFNKVEPWMEDGLSWAVANSIITSASSDTLILNPRHTATRAQCARMLMVFDSIEKAE